MAQKVRIELMDDITGEEAQETVRFGLDGVAYEIDLATASADSLRSALEIYVENARREKGGKGTRRNSTPVSGHREEVQRIRGWAQENGYEVNTRGRISKEVQNAYHAANG